MDEKVKLRLDDFDKRIKWIEEWIKVVEDKLKEKIKEFEEKQKKMGVVDKSFVSKGKL